MPLLSNVIHYHFPSSPKLFVHRCGRAARQGRVGFAMAIVDPSELSYMVDVHTFLGKEVCSAPPEEPASSDPTSSATVWSYTLQTMHPSLVHTGLFPQDVLDTENELVRKLLAEHSNLRDLMRVSENAMKQYHRTRAEASHTGVKLAKKIIKSCSIRHIHPLICGEDPEHSDENVLKKAEFIKHLQTFRPAHTILETGIGTGAGSVKETDAKGRLLSRIHQDSHGVKVMKELRAAVSSALERNKKHLSDETDEGAEVEDAAGGDCDEGSESDTCEIPCEQDEYLDCDEEDPEPAKTDMTSDAMSCDDNSLAPSSKRLSRHERKMLKRSKSTDAHSNVERRTFASEALVVPSDPSDSTAVVSMTQSDEGGIRGKGYKDNQYYMTYGTEDAVANFAEESMQPQSGLRSSEAISKCAVDCLADVR